MGTDLRRRGGRMGRKEGEGMDRRVLWLPLLLLPPPETILLVIIRLLCQDYYYQLTTLCFLNLGRGASKEGA